MQECIIYPFLDEEAVHLWEEYLRWAPPNIAIIWFSWPSVDKGVSVQTFLWETFFVSFASLGLRSFSTLGSLTKGMLSSLMAMLAFSPETSFSLKAFLVSSRSSL